MLYSIYIKIVNWNNCVCMLKEVWKDTHKCIDYMGEEKYSLFTAYNFILFEYFCLNILPWACGFFYIYNLQ